MDDVSLKDFDILTITADLNHHSEVELMPTRLREFLDAKQADRRAGRGT